MRYGAKLYSIKANCIHDDIIICRIGNGLEKLVGYPMAVLAGALNVTLEKPGHYAICGGAEMLKTMHVRDALRIMKTCAIIFCVSFVLPTIIILSYVGWWIYV